MSTSPAAAKIAAPAPAPAPEFASVNTAALFGNKNADFPALQTNGENFLEWKEDLTSVAIIMDLSEAMKIKNDRADVWYDNATISAKVATAAAWLIKRHLSPPLRHQFITNDPARLLKEIELRFEQQVSVRLPQIQK